MSTVSIRGAAGAVRTTVDGRARPAIRPRRPPLDPGAPRPHAWLGGDVAITALWDGFSAFLPVGERFFVRSVRHFQATLEDPRLRREVDAFIAQEALHAGAHQAWNAGFVATGHDPGRLAAPAAAVLGWLSRKRSPQTHLAVTCAIEHFTAIIAEVLLNDPALLAKADRRHARLWIWHAFEEIEHKAVAFDVLTAVVQGLSPWRRFRMRTRIFLETTLVFNAVLILNIRHLLAVHPWPRRLWAWLRISWYLWGRPGLYRRSAINYGRYLRPGFHPWQRDNRDLLSRWRPVLDEAGDAA